MAAIDLLRQAVQDARSLGVWALPPDEGACFPSADPPTLDRGVFQVLIVLALRDVYQAQQQLSAQVQTNTADISLIKQKLGLP